MANMNRYTIVSCYNCDELIVELTVISHFLIKGIGRCILWPFPKRPLHFAFCGLLRKGRSRGLFKGSLFIMFNEKESKLFKDAYDYGAKCKFKRI
jgi:hypothetical protein